MIFYWYFLCRGVALKADTIALNDRILKEVDHFQMQMKWDEPIHISGADLCKEVFPFRTRKPPPQALMTVQSDMSRW
jgi:hypothetical protein